MPVRRFSNEFFDAVTADLHGGTVASCKRRFTGQVDVRARLRGSELSWCGRFSVYEKTPSPIVHNFGDLAAGGFIIADEAGENRQACFVYLHNLQASPDRLPRYVLKCVVSVLTGGQVSFLYDTKLFLMVNAAVKEALLEEGLTRPNWNDLEAAYQRRVDRLAAAEPSGSIVFERRPSASDQTSFRPSGREC